MKKIISLCCSIGPLILAATSPSAHAWGHHYLITDRSLDSPELQAQLSASIAVEPLEKFIEPNAGELADLFAHYYDWLASTGSKRFIRAQFDRAHPTVKALLVAARLNPEVHFYYIRRPLPGEPTQGALVPYPSITRGDLPEPAFDYRFEDVTGQKITAREILDTYADEPDWWIDKDLWGYPEYGYGKPPYGKPTGDSAGAAFHNQFAHENWVVRTFAPEVMDGMVIDRLEMMTRLSRLAFKTNHPYWGYRFAAWAFHYIQDLSQPYHSKAAPQAGWWFYLKFVVSPDRARMKRDTTQLVYNRHHLFEDFVKILLEGYYREKNADELEMSADLSGHGEHAIDSGPLSVRQLFDRVMAISSGRAMEVDRAVAQAYGPRMTEDPGYDQETDKAYDPKASYARISPEQREELIRQTHKSWSLTGEATRRILEICRGP